MGGRMYPDDDKTRHFRAKRGSGRPGGKRGEVEVRYYDAGRTAVDEIVTDQLHLEMMSEKSCWMEVNGLHVWWHVERGKLIVTCFPDTCEPFAVTEEMAETYGTEIARPAGEGASG